MNIKTFDSEAFAVDAEAHFYLWCCDCNLRHLVVVEAMGKGAKDFKENLESAFTSTGTSTGKSNIDTTERGEGRQFDKIPVQQAISKGEGLESGKKLLGLSEEEANYFKKLFTISLNFCGCSRCTL